MQRKRSENRAPEKLSRDAGFRWTFAHRYENLFAYMDPLVPFVTSAVALLTSLLVLALRVLDDRRDLPKRALAKLEIVEAELERHRGEQRAFLLQAESEIEAMETLASRIETKRRQTAAHAQRAQAAQPEESQEPPVALDPVVAANLHWAARKRG